MTAPAARSARFAETVRSSFPCAGTHCSRVAPHGEAGSHSLQDPAHGQALGRGYGLIYYGIKTGLNEAFGVDRVTRDGWSPGSVSEDAG